MLGSGAAELARGAHSNSRIDCPKGATRFAQAAQRSRKGRLRNLFSAAQAWARAGQGEKRRPARYVRKRRYERAVAQLAGGRAD